MPDRRNPGGTRTSVPPPGYRQVKICMSDALHDDLKRLAIDRRSNVSEILRGPAEQELARHHTEVSG